MKECHPERSQRVALTQSKDLGSRINGLAPALGAEVLRLRAACGRTSLRMTMAVLALPLLALPLSAQSPAERATVDSFIRVVEQHLATDGEVDVDLMHHAETVFSDGVNKYDKWSRAWYGLGISRLELKRADVLAREGPELPIGMNNESGAEKALFRAIQLDHGFVAAAEALAFAPTAREGHTRLQERVNGGRPGYAVMSGPALAAAAYPEREAGSIDSAAALEERALAKGDVDSALVMLPLARDLYRLGVYAEGHQRLIAAAGTKTEAGQRAYRAELQWVASPAELAQWDSLPPAERPSWVAHFWSKRDVAEGRRDGARLQEHYRRIEYAMKEFRITLPKSGRQQMVTVAMPSTADPYQKERLARDLIRRDPATYPDAAALLDAGKTFGSESSSRYYHPIQDVINDKGIIWIRHGAPTKMTHNSTGPSFEIWRYERPEGALILYFRQVDFEGSNMPNELVPTVLDASAVILNQLCTLDQTLCPRTSGQAPDYSAPCRSTSCKASGVSDKPSIIASEIQFAVQHASGGLGPQAVVRSANRGKAFIDLATTTDTYHRDFAHAIHPAVQIVGVDRFTDGDPRMLVAFAIPAGDLSHEAIDGRTVYSVQFQLMSSAERTGKRVEFDTLRRFATPAPLTHGEFLTGTIEVPAAPGAYSTSLVMTQSDDHGAIAHLATIVIPDARGAFGISDLVLGATSSGVHWNSGASNVALNPLNTYPKGGSAETYFQLSGLTVGSAYTIQFEIYRADDDAKASPRLNVSSQMTATSVHMEIARSLGLANLDPARYRVRVTVSGDGKSKSAVAWLTVVK